MNPRLIKSEFLNSSSVKAYINCIEPRLRSINQKQRLKRLETKRWTELHAANASEKKSRSILFVSRKDEFEAKTLKLVLRFTAQ